MANISEDFEGTISLPFVGTWVQSDTSAYEGNYGYRSNAIQDSASSETELSVDAGTNGGTVSFFYKVRSEGGCDFGTFLIDDVQKIKVSGEGSWTLGSYLLTGGTHVLKWVYTKDSSSSASGDRFCIDKFRFENTPTAIPIFNQAMSCEV